MTPDVQGQINRISMRIIALEELCKDLEHRILVFRISIVIVCIGLGLAIGAGLAVHQNQIMNIRSSHEPRPFTP